MICYVCGKRTVQRNSQIVVDGTPVHAHKTCAAAYNATKRTAQSITNGAGETLLQPDIYSSAVGLHPDEEE